MHDEATREPWSHFYDRSGATVKVGDIIAYAHAVGRAATLRIGKVLKIERVHTEFMRRSAGWAIQVQGVEEFSFGAPRLCKRQGVLLYPERIIKLSTIPEDIATLLEPV
jgi:hypothetical protein